MDYDGSGRKPDPLCPTKEYFLQSGSHSITYNCNPGRVTVNYVYWSKQFIDKYNIVDSLNYSGSYIANNV